MDPVSVNRAAIILAGGDGTRLREYTRKIVGSEIPKQFCALLGEVSLLEQTRQRVSLSVPPGRTFFALNRDHVKFFSPLLRGVRAENLIVQPRNRGTAPAILYSLLRIAKVMPQASVLLMPSDHHVVDEAMLMKYVDEAFAAVDLQPELSVLLGAAPNEPETAYGWIEPGSSLSASPRGVFHVRRFWEKPSHEIAIKLMADGCLWNSFIIVARVSTLLGLFVIAMPELYASFARIRPCLGTVFEPDIMDRLYHRLRSSDFSRQVLEPAVPMNLCVLPMEDVGWSDLGEPQRVAKALTNLGIRQKWDAA